MKSVFNFFIKHKVYLLLLLSALISNPQPFNYVHANTNVYREESIVKVDAGKDHAGLLTSQGRLFLWGANGQGQLGNGNTSNQFLPIEITALSPLKDLVNDRIIDFSLGADHSGAVTNSGKVFMWGANGFNEGRLGNNNSFMTTSNVPIDITSQFNGLNSSDKIRKIDLGGQHSSALSFSGKVYMWGKIAHGRIGHGQSGIFSSNVFKPLLINTIQNSPLNSLPIWEKVVQVSLGSEHSSALTNLGRVLFWGRGHVGQLGQNIIRDESIPVDITSRFSGLTTGEIVSSLSLGREHSVALTNYGKVFTWGGGAGGRLGQVSEANVLVPRQINANGAFAQLTNFGDKINRIDAGLLHTIAVSDDGRLYTFGTGQAGRLGTNSETNQLTPIEITRIGSALFNLTPRTIHLVAAGFEHSVIATTDHQTLTFGIGNYGQTGQGTSTPSLTAQNISKNGRLVAVFNQNEAVRVMNLIWNLPLNPKISDRSLVLSAYTAYELLNNSQKNLVFDESIIKLNDAYKKVQILITDYERVISLIELIPPLSTIDIHHERSINDARVAYNALNSEQKTFISTLLLTKLTEAENKIIDIKLLISTVKATIAQLPTTITLANRLAIEAARLAYDSLSIEQQKKVDNYQLLLQVEEKLQLEYQEVETLINEINRLHNISPITLFNENAIRNARSSFILLDSLQQALVTNLTKLVELETSISNLYESILVVEALIDALPNTVTLINEQIVNDAKQAYDALHISQQEKISTQRKTKLNNLIAQIAQKKAEIVNVVLMIHQLPLLNILTLDDEEKVINARQAYEALDSSQKPLITNYADLQKLEGKIINLIEELNNVISLISALPKTVTLIHEQDVIEARNAYDLLQPSQQTRISQLNLNKLLLAETQIQKELAEIQDVINEINRLPNPNNVTLDDEESIITSRENYESLDEIQQSRITNSVVQTLVTLEGVIIRLKQEIRDVESLIANLPATSVITLANEQDVIEARNAYDLLQPSQQEQLGNLTQLIASEAKIKSLLDAIFAVEALIAALPNLITMEHIPVIDLARSAYENLSLLQQDRVANLRFLVDAEARIIALQVIVDNFIIEANEIDMNNQSVALLAQVEALLRLSETFDPVMRELLSFYIRRLEIQINQIGIELKVLAFVQTPIFTFFLISLFIVLPIVIFVVIYQHNVARLQDKKSSYRTFGSLE